MNLSLGKKIFIFISTSIILIGVEVTTRVNKTVAYRGDNIQLYIEVKNSSNSNIIFPDIYKIGLNNVTNPSTQQSTSIINGKRVDSYTKIYTFAIDKTVIIPSYIVKIGGTEYKTKKLIVEVVKPQKAGKNAPIQLQLKVDKKSYYDGEGIKLDLIFKQLPNVKYDDIKLSIPDFKDFWMKKISEGIQGRDKNYVTQTYSYLLFSKKMGNVKIPSSFVNIGINEGGRSSNRNSIFSFFQNSLTWKKIYSNSINLNIKPLPENSTIYGDFKIKVDVDKFKVKANEPVNLTIKIEGTGNLDDIEKFNLSINNAIPYSDELQVEAKVKQNRYSGSVIQKIAIVSDSNFTIPSIELKFFNSNSKKVETISTKPIKITVEKSLQHNSSKLQIEEKISSKDISKRKEDIKTIFKEKNIDKILWFSIGFISSILLFILFLLIKKLLILISKDENKTIEKIKKAKNDKDILLILLSLSKINDDIKNFIYKLERNIYTKEDKIKIDKKEIIKIIYNI